MRRLIRRSVLPKIAFVLGLGLASSVSLAARDRMPPSRPTNLRVTAMTAHRISLAWNPSSDNSGTFYYHLRDGAGNEATLPQSQTSYNWGINPSGNRSFSFVVYAVDAAGNRSANSNRVSGTSPPDNTPPAKPAVSLTEVGPVYVRLAWSSSDDGHFVWFNVYRDGVAVINQTASTAGLVTGLQPQHTYAFTVRARDLVGNWSAISDPLMVTTTAQDSADITPPSVPANLFDNSFPDGEIWLFWDDSADDFDSPAAIQYNVYNNGAFDHSIVGLSQTIFYGVPFGLNNINVTAQDSVGNESQPAPITVDLRP